MSRRSFLHRAGGVVLGLFGLSNGLARANRGGATTLTILHTNDIHGHPAVWKGWEGDLKGKTIGGLLIRRLSGLPPQWYWKRQFRAVPQSPQQLGIQPQSDQEIQDAII